MNDAIYMTTDQAAELLGVSPRTLEDWRYRGCGPSYRKLGRSVRYLKSQVIEWAEEAETESTSQTSASL